MASTPDLNGNLRVDLFDASGAQIATGVDGINVDSYISPFDGASGTYYARLSRAASDYILVVTRGAAFDLEPNSLVGLETQAIDGRRGVLGYAASDDDVYSFQVVAGQQLDFQGFVPGNGPLQFPNNLVLRMQLLDAAGTVVATDNALIEHTALQTAVYQLRVSAAAGSGEYYVSRSTVNNLLCDFDDDGACTLEGYRPVGGRHRGRDTGPPVRYYRRRDRRSRRSRSIHCLS